MRAPIACHLALLLAAGLAATACGSMPPRLERDNAESQLVKAQQQCAKTDSQREDLRLLERDKMLADEAYAGGRYDEAEQRYLAIERRAVTALQDCRRKKRSGRAERRSAAGSEREPAAQPAIVAVFDIHDASGRLAERDLHNLTRHLAAALAETRRYQVVPRNQLRARLHDEKNDSYRACYDQGCQIAVGKAMAAEKALSTTVATVGARCRVTAELFDLERETATRGASVEAACSPEALFEAATEVASRLGRP